MQTDLFRVIFTGKLDGAIPVEVTKANLVELLGQNHKKTAPFFNGKPFVIKKKIDRAAAEKCRITFKKAGAICIIKPESVRRKAPLEEFCDSNSPSTKPLCTITTVDIGKVDLKFSPLTCSQLTGISEGIKTHRPEKNTVSPEVA